MCGVKKHEVAGGSMACFRTQIAGTSLLNVGRQSTLSPSIIASFCLPSLYSA